MQIQRDHPILNLPSSIKHTHHIVMMKDGMCPFHLWERLPPLLKAHGSKCIVHDPSTDEMGSDHSLTKRSEPLVLPTDRWLELIHTNKALSEVCSSFYARDFIVEVEPNASFGIDDEKKRTRRHCKRFLLQQLTSFHSRMCDNYLPSQTIAYRIRFPLE